MDTPSRFSNDSEFVIPVHGNHAILSWRDMTILDIIYSIAIVRIVQSDVASSITRWP